MSKPTVTYCRICEAACGLEVTYDSAGQPSQLRPDKAHPVSKGFACAKGTRFLETARHPDRLLHPMRRGDDGALSKVSWNDAIAETGRHMRESIAKHGPHSVGMYFGNPFAFNSMGAIALAGFMKGLGSRNIYSAGSQDCNNKFAGATIVHGSPIIHPLPDFDHAELVILFGTNPAISQSSFVHLEGGSTVFDRIAARGAKIIWVDPRRTESAKRWGEHVAIRSGTDAFLLLGLLNLLRDLKKDDDRVEGLTELLAKAAAFPPERVAKATGISENAILELATQIRESKATAFHMSVGVNQSGFGTFTYVLLQALTYLSGNLDQRGGNLFHPYSVRMADIARSAGMGVNTVYSRIGSYPSTLDTLPGGILADEILTPGDEQVRVLLVVAGEPLRTMPDAERLRKAFRNLEWLVVIDLFETETGREADLLLPAESWLERFDFATTTLTFQHAPLLQFGRAVMSPMGESRSEARILADIAKAVGGKLNRAMLPVRWLAKLEFGHLMEKLVTLVAGVAKPFGGNPKYGFKVHTPAPATYLGKGPRTPGHKVHFWSPELEPELARLESAEFDAEAQNQSGGFMLLGRRRRLGHNGWLQGGGRDGEPEAFAWLHPQDAAGLGIPAMGGKIRLETEAGALEIRAIANEGTPLRSVVLPHGIPGLNFNDLVSTGSENIDRLSGQHRMTGIPVRVTSGVAR